ncbi:molybdate ABC transporter substrate-binding protein [Rheinheimera riviphila]|nr:molybdate ABC transporter substrate-binding protein [Rheinheimera riviphila]
MNSPWRSLALHLSFPKLLLASLLLLPAFGLVSAETPNTKNQAFTTTPLRIAAASDLRYVLDQIATQFTQQYPQLQLDIVYGSSGKLSTQIAAGAPFAVFFSADEAYVTPLLQRGVAQAPVQLIGLGQLVLWSKQHDARKIALADLKQSDIKLKHFQQQFKRIAIAEPSHAPYGDRSRELLQRLGLWQQLQPNMVTAENVAKAAQLAHSGAVDAGIFALAIALSDDYAAGYCQRLDHTLHQPLRQVMVLTSQGATRPDAQDFAAFMRSAGARQLLRSYGFIDPDFKAPAVTDDPEQPQPSTQCQQLEPADG